MRTTAVAALTLTAALALGACQDEVTSASPSSTAASSSASTTEGPSSATNPAPTTRAWSTTPGKSSTRSSAATSSSASSREAISSFDFKNATWTTEDGSKVTLKNGELQAPGTYGDTRYYRAMPAYDMSWTSTPIYYDLNDDGYEDAVVDFQEAEGNGYSDTPVVWLGGPGGPRQLTNSELPSAQRCGIYIKSVKVVDGGTIFVEGAERSENQVCAEMPNKPFTRTFSVTGNRVVEQSVE